MNQSYDGKDLDCFIVESYVFESMAILSHIVYYDCNQQSVIRIKEVNAWNDNGVAVEL